MQKFRVLDFVKWLPFQPALHFPERDCMKIPGKILASLTVFVVSFSLITYPMSMLSEKSNESVAYGFIGMLACIISGYKALGYIWKEQECDSEGSDCCCRCSDSSDALTSTQETSEFE